MNVYEQSLAVIPLSVGYKEEFTLLARKADELAAAVYREANSLCCVVNSYTYSDILILVEAGKNLNKAYNKFKAAESVFIDHTLKLSKGNYEVYWNRVGKRLKELGYRPDYPYRKR